MRSVRLSLLAFLWLLALFVGWLSASLDVSRQRVHVRWAPSISESDRRELERSLGLSSGEHREGRTWSYLVRDQSRANMEKLLASSSIEDTAHIDRTNHTIMLDRPAFPRWLVELAEAGRIGMLAALVALAASIATWMYRDQLRPLVAWARQHRQWLMQRAVSFSMGWFFIRIAYEYLTDMWRGGHDWVTADWLMNYFHGPVRRGLIGTLLFQVADLGVPLKWLLYGVQVAILAAIFLLVIHIYNLRRRESAWIAVLCSPAFLLFQYHDTGGAFRKEILVFLSFALLCVAYARQRLTTANLIGGAALFVLAAFSHEIAAFTLPFFIYITYRLRTANLIGQSAAVTAASFFVIVSIAAGSFALAFRGDAALAASLCASLLERGFGPQICEGSLAWLDKDGFHGLREYGLDPFRYSLTYLALLGLSLVPLWFAGWRGRERWTLTLGGLAFMLPLSVAGIDWGRWLHVYVFCLFSVVLAESAREHFEVRRLPLALVLLYVTAWSVPICCEYSIGWGFLGDLYEYVRRPAV